MATSNTPPPAPGRPRDASREAAILDAAEALLTEVGYERMSVEAIAARANASKATIYRRWPDKAAVVAAALERRDGPVPPAASGKDLRADLIAVLVWLVDEIAGEDTALLAAVLTGMRVDPALAEAMRGRLERDESAMIAHTLEAARRRGQALETDAETLFAEVAPAIVTHRLLIVRRPCDRAFVEHVVDDVLLPLLVKVR